MRFQLFKMFESRTSELSESEFKKILHQKCSQFVKNPRLLQRSKREVNFVYSYINPKIFTREPLQSNDGAGVSSKHHILLMENLPSWKDFPKRSKSIIGLTSPRSDYLFGNQKFLVIPFDGAKFGVAPSADLWSCKAEFTKERALTDDLGISFDDRFSYNLRSLNISDSDYQTMMNDFEERRLKRQKILASDDFTTTIKKRFANKLFDKVDEYGFKTVEDAFSYFLSPDRFRGTDLDELEGFKVMNWNELNQIPESQDCEFWTESECLLFYLCSTTPMSSSTDRIEDAYDTFLNDFINI
jgi:hypothetical protein